MEILLLMEIYDRKSLNQVDLVKRFHVTDSNISQATKKLLEKGLIIKRMDSRNNTKNVLLLSETGEELCELLLILFRDWNNKVIKDIPLDDLISFGETIEKINENCIKLI